MSLLSSVPYYFATCSGKTGNLRSPRCLTEGPGSLDESEATEAAEAQGWHLGAKCYCPAHKDQAPPVSETAPAPKRRRKPAESDPLADAAAAPQEQN